jgi:predicted SprT family Zn-dependent metalloprotease
MEIYKALKMKKDSQEFFSEKQKIVELAEKTWNEVKPLVQEKYPEFEWEKVKCELNPRLRSTGGRASLRSKKIELNERLLAKNLEHVRMVFIHELSHLIDYHVRGKSNHDYFFHSIMESLGCEGTTYMPKGLDKSAVPERKKTARIAHHCEEGCVHMLTKYKAGKVARGANYVCRKSGKSLKLGTGPMPEPKTELEKQLLEMSKNFEESQNIIG